MSLPALLTFVLFVAVVTVAVRPLGGYLARVFERQATRMDPICEPIERWLYRLAGVDPTREMTAAEYAFCFVASRPRW